MDTFALPTSITVFHTYRDTPVRRIIHEGSEYYMFGDFVDGFPRRCKNKIRAFVRQHIVVTKIPYVKNRSLKTRYLSRILVRPEGVITLTGMIRSHCYNCHDCVEH